VTTGDGANSGGAGSAGGAPTVDERAALQDLLARAARRRGRVRLVYGSMPYLVDVLAFDGELVTGASEGRGVLRFRMALIREAAELPSSDPLF
jgi:hypothetical protein